jgi:hypothetical protein
VRGKRQLVEKVVVGPVGGPKEPEKLVALLLVLVELAVEFCAYFLVTHRRL